MLGIGSLKRFFVAISPICLPLLVILLFVSAVFFYIPYKFEFEGSEAFRNEYLSIYYCLSLAFTALLISIAWIQLEKFSKTIISQNDTTKGQFLLKIDWRWSNAESVEAREIIHELYLEGEAKFSNHMSDKARVIDYVAGRIVQLRDSKNKKDIRKFIILLNFLDFMETVGYFYYKKYVGIDDLLELCGCSLDFNYQIFRFYIKDKRTRNQNKEFYKYFAALYDVLNEQNQSGKIENVRVV